jgi:hypothetical protein
MINRLVLQIIFLISAVSANAQLLTGFYVVIEDQTNCTNLVPSRSESRIYCLPKEPIVTANEFESLSAVKDDKKTNSRYINLKLTAEAFKTLKTLTSRLPDTRLALLVDDKVVGIFDKKGKSLNRTMKITGPSPSIDWIYERLKKKGP